MAGESVHAALLPVDHADRGRALETRLPERLHGLDGGTAGGDDVLDDADAVALRVDPFEAVGGPVVLGLLADDQEREPRLERRGRRERDRTQFRAGDQLRVGRVLTDRCGKALPDRPEQVGPRLEAVLVEVVAGAPTRAEQEVALEVRVLPERAAELVVVHPPRAAFSAARASGSRRAASGAPLESDCIEPSSK